MNWLFESKPSPREQDEQIEEYPLILDEKDFMKIISLEQRYNYFKSLIKVQQLNNINEQNNEKNMLRVMTELIEYYAMCITEAERNIENIVNYFQLKIKDLNNHYKKVIDKHRVELLTPSPVNFQSLQSKQLGTIQVTLQTLNIPQPQAQQKEGIRPQQVKQVDDAKTSLNKTLLIALQSQNIQEHLAQANKKADFLKKSIASSIKMQQDKLQKRIRQGKKKKILNPTKDNVSNTNTTETSSASRKIFRKSQTLTNLAILSSDSELDEAQSLFIENFIHEEESGSQKSKQVNDKK